MLDVTRKRLQSNDDAFFTIPLLFSFLVNNICLHFCCSEIDRYDFQSIIVWLVSSLLWTYKFWQNWFCNISLKILFCGGKILVLGLCSFKYSAIFRHLQMNLWLYSSLICQTWEIYSAIEHDHRINMLDAELVHG